MLNLRPRRTGRCQLCVRDVSLIRVTARIGDRVDELETDDQVYTHTSWQHYILLCSQTEKHLWKFARSCCKADRCTYRFSFIIRCNDKTNNHFLCMPHVREQPVGCEQLRARNHTQCWRVSTSWLQGFNSRFITRQIIVWENYVCVRKQI